MSPPIMTSVATTEGVPVIRFVLEDYTQRVIIAGVLAVVFIVGISGNALVILAVALSRRLRSSTNWFVVNLAATDFIACMFVPFHMVALLSRQGWPLPDWICEVSGGMTFMCVASSTTTLALIAFNRWCLLTKSRSVYMSIFTQKKVIALVVSAWLYSVLVVVVPSVTGVGKPGYSYKFKTCTYYDGDGYISATLFGVVLGVGMLFLPAILIVTFYSLIYVYVTRHTRKMMSQMRMAPNLSEVSSSGEGLSPGENPSTLEIGYPTSGQNDSTSRQDRASAGRSAKILDRRHIKFTKKMALVVGVFFACILPNIFMTALPLDSILFLLPWTHLLVVINSSLNPIIYAWAIPSFRKVMGCLVRSKCKNNIAECTSHSR